MTFWLGSAALGTAVAAAPAPQQLFRSPEQAVDALVEANRDNRVAVLSRILGPAGSQLIHSGDPVADRSGRAHFVAAYDAAHRIELESADKAVLIVGTEDWPLPIPLVRNHSGWRFDTPAGEREILDRRIGRNELNVIEVCRTFVQAQREFAALQAASGARAEFAQHFMSRRGRHDGLYWPTAADEPESPLGPLLAQARAAGYATEPAHGKSVPYHGYYYRMLTGQGSHAPGGARNYIVDGHMSGGFALLAYPAIYGDSGIMTFIVDQDGIVYQKNLGPDTARNAPRITRYDPDPSWHAP
ncbi:MAG: DUF2950 domain-containing protein [Steroidobacterales bacterium]